MCGKHTIQQTYKHTLPIENTLTHALTHSHNRTRAASTLWCVCSCFEYEQAPTEARGGEGVTLSAGVGLFFVQNEDGAFELEEVIQVYV